MTDTPPDDPPTPAKAACGGDGAPLCCACPSNDACDLRYDVPAGRACAKPAVDDAQLLAEMVRRCGTRFRDFAAATSDWFWEMGPDLRFKWFSATASARSGLAMGHLIGQTRDAGRIDGDDDAGWAQHLADLAAHRPFRDFRYRRLAADGNVVWYSVSGIPMHDDGGRFLGYRGTACNVSAEMRSAERAATAQQRLYEAIDAIEGGFAWFDRDDRLAIFNDRYRQTLAGAGLDARPGLHLPQIVRALLESGEFRISGLSIDCWIDQLMVHWRQGRSCRTYGTADGRWVEVNAYATTDGGRLVLMSDATARHAAERALKKSDASLRTAQRIARLGSWEITLASNEMWWSDELGRLLGRPGAAPTYGRFLDALHPADRERVDAAVHRTLYADAGFALECRMIHPDRGERWLAMEGEATFDDAGQPLTMAATLQDITAEKSTAAKLQMLSQAIEQSAAAVMVTDADGHIQFVNQAFVAITGYRPEEVVGRTPRILKSDLTPAAVHANLWATILRGEPWRHELCNRRKDGSHYWANAQIAPVRDDQGEIRHFVGVQIDISEQRQAERALRASEARFRTLVETSLLGLAIEIDGRPVFANRTFARLFGYDDAAQVLELPSIATLVAADEWPRLERLRQAAGFEAGEPPAVQGEFRGRRRDGSEVWVHLQIQPTQWNGGSQARQVLVIDISLSKRYEEQLRHQALFDPLTDLPNRVLALDRLRTAIAAARRRQQQVAVLFIDVDHFKKVNDTLGHAVGDRLLGQLAKRIAGAVREGDTVARLGGDEFSVVLPAINGRAAAEAVAMRVIAAAATPFDLDGQEVFVSVSVGIGLYPDDGHDADDLLCNADAAMYLIKEQGRGTHGFYTPELNERLRRRVRIEGALRHALDRDELSLVYQPLIDLATGAIVGAEALLRWTSGELGPVPPDQFIPIAEDCGQIVAIGAWVLNTACAEARRWREAGLTGLGLAVNVSSRQFRGRGLVEAVTAALAGNGLAADGLELEITETLLMEDVAEVQETLRRLEARGIRLAVDDFGTGYSSLSYLSRFPLDTLKIDRSFIDGVDANAAQATLVEAMIGMAHRLSLRVVAEGVETAAQCAFLRRHGCDLAQGYLFSRPLAAADFRRLAADWPQRRPAPLVA